MSNIKLSLDDIAYINMFEKITKAGVKDCIVNEDKGKVTFVVNEGQVGMAIGKGGANVKKMQNKLNKKIEILEYSEDPLKFLANILRPVKLKNAYVSERSDGKKTIHASVMRNNYGLVRSKINTAKKFMSKYYKFDDIIIK